MRLYFFIITFLLILGCTNFGLDQLDERVTENLYGNLKEPGDIDPSGTDQFSFVVIGDTHVGSPGGEVYQRVLQDAKNFGDAFVVIAGDLTHGGKGGEFDQFNAVADDAGIEVRAAIGNHDIFFGGWNEYKAKLGKSIYSFSADNVHFAMIDTANGVLGEAQLKWLESNLGATNKTHKIIVTHFPPWNGHFSSIYKMSSEEEAAILKDIAYRTGVKYVFSGHFHGANEITLGGVKYVVTGGANDIMDPGQSSHYVRVFVDGAAIRHEVIYY